MCARWNCISMAQGFGVSLSNFKYGQDVFIRMRRHCVLGRSADVRVRYNMSLRPCSKKESSRQSENTQCSGWNQNTGIPSLRSINTSLLLRALSAAGLMASQSELVCFPLTKPLFTVFLTHASPLYSAWPCRLAQGHLQESGNTKSAASNGFKWTGTNGTSNRSPL